MREELRVRAGEDLDCDEDALSIRDVDHVDRFVVEGCGKKKAYRCRNSWTEDRPTRRNDPWPLTQERRTPDTWGGSSWAVTTCRLDADLSARVMREESDLRHAAPSGRHPRVTGNDEDAGVGAPRYDDDDDAGVSNGEVPVVGSEYPDDAALDAAKPQHRAGEHSARRTRALPPRPTVPSRDHVIGAELAMTHRSTARDAQLVLSPLLHWHYAWLPWLQLEIDWGTVWLVERGQDGEMSSSFVSGNPLLGARVRWVEDPHTRLSVSLGVTAPLAWIGEGLDSGPRRRGLALAAATRGFWDAWLWAPEQAGAVLGAAFEHGERGSLHLLVEADGGATVPVGDVTADAYDLYGQLALEAATGEEGTEFGVRLQGIAVTADGDPLQFALGPYIAWTQLSWRPRLSLLLNLDEPLGFVGTGLDIWGLRASGEFPL